MIMLPRQLMNVRCRRFVLDFLPKRKVTLLPLRAYITHNALRVRSRVRRSIYAHALKCSQDSYFRAKVEGSSCKQHDPNASIRLYTDMSDTIEYRALLQCSYGLTDLLQHDSSVASKLLEKGLIPKDVYDWSLTAHGVSSHEKASRFVSCFTDLVKDTPGVFHEFVSVLEGDPFFAHIVEKLNNVHSMSFKLSIVTCSYQLDCHEIHLVYLSQKFCLRPRSFLTMKGKEKVYIYLCMHAVQSLNFFVELIASYYATMSGYQSLLKPSLQLLPLCKARCCECITFLLLIVDRIAIRVVSCQPKQLRRFSLLCVYLSQKLCLRLSSLVTVRRTKKV